MNLNPGRWLKNRFNNSLHRHGYAIRKLSEVKPFDDLLYRRLKQNPNFCFVQIGANDGMSFDPVYEFATRERVKGMVVEPLSDCYQKLVHNYHEYPDIRPLNVAIHKNQAYVDLYRTDPAFSGKLPDWAIGIASFDPDHFKLGGKVPEEAICVERVTAMTLDALLEHAGYADLDLLQIDTEGYDYEILHMLDFAKYRPAIIHFEHGIPQGIMDDSQLIDCFKLLRQAGYFIMMEKYDVIAVEPGLLPG